ncbi:MAG: acetyl-CoA carboxylase carboxyltransferase subunit alpha, partial [Candidatus Neomarinimicrobiota bacterium]
MKYYLEFEEPIRLLDEEIHLKESILEPTSDVTKEIALLQEERLKLINKIHSGLNRWQRVQLARHPERPYSLDYIKLIFTDFFEIHGDRLFADDPAVVTGFGKINNKKVAIIAQQKGRNTKENLHRNFGMMKPEGYRKAMRVMKLAEKFKIPIITFMDTPGAFPGIGAEERGQGEAIANNLIKMSGLKVPVISVVIGEGASGGALGIGVCDKFLMMQNSWYSVISPEGCASILFRDASKAEDAAEALKVTPYDMV